MGKQGRVGRIRLVWFCPVRSADDRNVVTSSCYGAHMDSLQGTEKRDHWPRLYDSFGRLTLGTLLMRVRSHKKLQLSESLLQSLAHVRDLRNRLVHGFLRPTDSPLSDVERLADATRELQMAASLFRNSVRELERTAYTALDQLRVTRAEVEEQISTRPAEIG